MKYHKHASDAVFWYLNELGSRVVANTGIPSDRHHIGKLILQSLKDAPDFIMQVDGGTGKFDTFQDALEKSVACANAFRAIGLKADDVIVLMAPNHNDLAMPAYAALYLGIIVAGVDMSLGIKELEDTFTTTSPKVIICESEKAGDVAEALSNIKIMKYHKHASDAIFWYLNELGSRVVANTGIPSDRHHMGKLILQSLKDAPDFILQVDGGTGQFDTFQDALEKSVACAKAFRAIGLKAGDIIVLMAPNHNDLAISAYAALYLGIIVSGVDMTLGIKELEDTFKSTSPKVVFCESKKAGDVAEALTNIKLNARIVTLNNAGRNDSFSEFITKYGNNSPAEEFKIMSSTFPTPVTSCLVTSPVQWLSAIFTLILSPILRFTRIQSSLPVTREHAYFLINKYKPTYAIFSPPMATTLTKPEECDKCDFSCFKVLLLGGSAVSQTLLENVKKIATEAEVYVAYGFSEIGSFAFNFVSSAPGSVGSPLAYLQHRLINPDTQEDILEPNKTGELWVKGPVTFKGYYNNPVATAEAFLEDGWIKSGDLFYRDENFNYFFVYFH
ncbi:Luciferin 4-monooxygenase [Papilio machaon]|uniref:Luciferin 4-monooxygenase n=1 Tax=Papilio machaon TaxID=76193 RepID=A0A194R1A4_PAPMA|nr:Luciferin 4-monooxygenase [Papilio machaon]